jgi:CRISPR-associated protein Csm2
MRREKMANHQNRQGYKNNKQQLNKTSLNLNDVAFTINGEIDKNLFSEKAEKIATILASADKDTNSYTQIRRFYDEVSDFYDEIMASDDKESAFKSREPLILMINSKVAYAKGRGKVDNNFVNFIKHALSQVDDAESFKIFKLLFEAVMGFLRAKKAK